MRHGSLFSGIGGFDLASEWMGWENVFHCEIESFPQQILKHYWPNAISYDDIKQTDFTIHRGSIDILTGGFPCQGFSLAGNRLGTDDNRYLWPEYLRSIKEIRPPWVIGENVAGITSMEDKSGIWKEVFAKVENRKIVRYDTIDEYEAIYTRQAKMLISTICEDLEKEGYEVQPIIIPAAAVGAPHKRERIWFIAYSADTRAERMRSGKDKVSGHKVITNSSSEGLQSTTRRKQPGISRKEEKLQGRESSRTFTKGYGWQNFPTQSPVCSRDDGISDRLDGITFPKWRNESIKGYGNAVVPQVVYEIFKVIKEMDK